MTGMLCLGEVMADGQGIIGHVSATFSHQPVAGASVVISLGDAIAHETSTDSLGKYVWQTEQAGRIKIRISADGFSAFEQEDILLDGYSTKSLNHLLGSLSFDLPGVTVVAKQNTAASFIRTITPDDILQVAGNFEDPVRIAHSQPGIVLLNDQANQLSARGQSPIFNSWYLEGLEIVNPNHTSNAGTFSDLPTQYGGGVNMFSAQTLGSTDVYMGVNPVSIGSNTGAVIDMHLHESAKPEWRAKAGLLGMELGGGAALGPNSILDFNLRYSFTGILTNLGADFGGEKINFYDGVVSFRNEGTHHKLKLFAWAGRSINEFDHVEAPEEREREKDFYDIDYGNNILGTGGRYDLQLSQRLLLRSGFAYSTNKSSYHKYGPYDGNVFQNNIDQNVSLTSAFVEFSISHSARIKTIAGLDFTNRTYTGAEASTLRPYFTTSIKLAPAWEIDLGGELQYTFFGEEWIPGYRGQLNWLASESHTVFAGMRHSASDPFFLVPYSWPYVHSTSKTYEVGWVGTLKKQNFGLNIYYQQLNRLTAYYLSETVFEYIADHPNSGYAGVFGRRGDGVSRHYGVEGRWSFKTPNGWGLRVNQTIYKSVRGLEDSTLTPGRYNGKFATHLVVSKEIIREADGKNKIWNFALRGIFNGGLWEPEIDQTGPIFTDYQYPVSYDQQLPDYIRIDAGISRTIAYKKLRWRYSLDIQNVAGMTNVAYHYYDRFLEEVVTQNQLGIIPVLSVQASW